MARASSRIVTAADAANMLTAARERHERAADRDLEGYLRAVRALASAGHREAFFSATDECTDEYWQQLGRRLEALGYTVDLSFLRERRTSALGKAHVGRVVQSVRNTRSCACADWEGNEVICCQWCCTYDGENLREVGDFWRPRRGIRVWRLCAGLLGLLWWLTLLGPLLFGVGCCDNHALVCDDATCRCTRARPYTHCWCCERYQHNGAIWAVRVSWDDPAPVSPGAPAKEDPPAPCPDLVVRIDV